MDNSSDRLNRIRRLKTPPFSAQDRGIYMQNGRGNQKLTAGYATC